MKRVAFTGILFFVYLITLPSVVSASFLHAPHSADKGIQCSDCHASSFEELEYQLPIPSTIDDTVTNYICQDCHNGSPVDPLKDGPDVGLHSQLGMQGGSKRIGWTTECINCHDPHFQSQVENYQGVCSISGEVCNDFSDCPQGETCESALYIITGVFNCVTDNGDGTSTFPYWPDNVQAGLEDRSTWGAKTNVGRGLVFVADTTDLSFKKTFEIISADSGYITVQGIAPSVCDFPPVYQNFGIIYGQMIRSEVASTPVVFTDKSSFADNESCTEPGFCSESTTQSCSVDGDCPGVETCQTGSCSQRPAISCTSDADPFCLGEACLPGVCSISGAACDDVQTCPGGEGICVDRYCADLTCVSDADCRSWCSETTDQACTVDGDCPLHCSMTTDLTCVTDADCPQQNTCSMTTSLPCNTDEECPQQNTCSITTSLSCSFDLECPQQDTCSVSTAKICSTDLDCPQQDTCSISGAVCVSDDECSQQKVCSVTTTTLCTIDDDCPTDEACVSDICNLLPSETCNTAPSETCNILPSETCNLAPNETCSLASETCENELCGPDCSAPDSDPTGLCQVCHVDTKYWQADGSGANHPADQCRNYPTGHCPDDPQDCSSCHKHEKGFAHCDDCEPTECGQCHFASFDLEPSKKGKHPTHLDIGASCFECHDTIWRDGNGDIVIDYLKCKECHQDGRGGLPNVPEAVYTAKWDAEMYPDFEIGCDGCHNGRPDVINYTTDCYDPENPNMPPQVGQCCECHGVTASDLPLVMDHDGHGVLETVCYVRQYDCYYCHTNSVDKNYNLNELHTNGSIDVAMDLEWKVADQDPPALPTYDETTKSCGNMYCHSDGTTKDPIMDREYPWDGERKECNACHGHSFDVADPASTCLGEDGTGCHHIDEGWDPRVASGDPAEPPPCTTCHENPAEDYFGGEKRWLSSMPMYVNEGTEATAKSNTHFRHLFTGFACDDCHAYTVKGGSCDTQDCHPAGDPVGPMSQEAHVDGEFHVNKERDVHFKDGGTYNPLDQSCSDTACHTGGSDPVWGGSVNDAITCYECHSTPEEDIDDYGAFNGIQARINFTEWQEQGHGRPFSAGSYPKSGNPPAAFPLMNGCWYCHDNEVYHDTRKDPYRLRMHEHFKLRFEKECVYCHMSEDPNTPGQYEETQCLVCHNDPTGETLAPQLDNTPSNHASNTDDVIRMSVCSDCHQVCADASDCLGGEFCTTRGGLGTVCTDEQNPEIVDHVDCAGCHTWPYPDIWTLPDHREYNQTLDPGPPTIDGETSCSAAGCHYDDTTRHKTGSEDILWTADQKDNVRNLYMMIGVCLKCHDDDAGGQCGTCHLYGVDNPQTPNVDEALKYRKGFDPGVNGTHFIQSQDAVASSFHYGYKHFIDFEESMVTVYADGLVSETATSKTELKFKEIGGNPPNWTPYEWKGYSVKLNDGVNKGELRYIEGNDEDTLYLAREFSNPVQLDESCSIHKPVNKGGKFCWDCHDPHGDSNIYMVHDQVALETDGIYGQPVFDEQTQKFKQASVVFTDNKSGLNYARISRNPETNEYDGICNVCHESGTQHYHENGGDGHMGGRVCTTCHEHRFTESHAGQQNCDECHADKPVPRHSGFGQPRDCTKCHQGAVGSRMDVMGQLQANSHHVQGVEVTSKHCYACHWEATEVGVIDPLYHKGYDRQDHITVPNADVDLVIWGEDESPGVDDNPTVSSRPRIYDIDGSKTGTPTVILFQASNISKSDGTPEENLAAQRGEVDKITTHCLGCHSDKNNDTKPFDDGKTPRQYAWDFSSIDNRYSKMNTTTWGKYTTAPNAAKKDLQKAYSAHGNAVDNEGGFDANTGIDGDITSTRDGMGGARNYNIQCFDCHSSHGSMGDPNIDEVTSAYITFDGTMNGANLKQTTGGKGGYTVTYKATANTDSDSVNFYEAGAGQCFDCHETANAGTYIPASGDTPWGYESTFGAEAPIIGWKDNPRFTGNYPGRLTTDQKAGRPVESIVDLSFRQSKSTMGGHLKVTSPLEFNAMEPINGLCTPCHDPHGVSEALGPDMDYGVPLLKGQYMTSPYKDDAPPPNPYKNTGIINASTAEPEPTECSGDGDCTVGGSTCVNGECTNETMYRSWGRRRTNARYPEYDPEGKYNIDRVVFGNGTTRISETDEQFAGLCLQCHPRDHMEDGNQQNTAFRGKDRIHESVKGWGQNTEHSFTCSKCHQPHASGLPRLMQTNCLDVKHRGGRTSGGQAWYTLLVDNRADNMGGEYRGYPINSLLGNNASNYATNKCHVEADDNPGSYPTRNYWNDVTRW